MANFEPAALALADGTVFRGRSIGACGTAVGEVVFNTAITGYQGPNPEAQESRRTYAEGLVVRDLPRLHSNWRAKEDLASYLKKKKVVGIADIDTRKLTRILREKGAQNGCLVAGEIDIDSALEKARAFPGLAGMDLARVVTTQKPYEWTEGSWQGAGEGYRRIENARFHVVAYDYGIKHNILRMIADRGARV